MTIDYNILILWLIRLGYLFITLICAKNASKPNIHEPDKVLKYRLKWCSMSILITLIGITSIFNLHVHLTGFFREYAFNEGWYQYRRQFQVLFLAGLISFGILINLALHSKLSGISISNRRILYGITFLMCVILLDSVSFHPVDQVFNNGIFGCNMRLVLELIGIFWITISLLIKINKGPKNTLSPKGNRKIRFV